MSPAAAPSPKTCLVTGATDPDWAGGSLYVDERTRTTAAPPEQVWRVVEGIGGSRGWYSFPLAWEVRGGLDRLVGDVGLRRGRRDPDRLFVGDALDFWRVEERDRPAPPAPRGDAAPGSGLAGVPRGTRRAGRRDRAAAAGHVRPAGSGRSSLLVAIAAFHGIVFGGMVQGIIQAAEE